MNICRLLILAFLLRFNRFLLLLNWVSQMINWSILIFLIFWGLFHKKDLLIALTNFFNFNFIFLSLIFYLQILLSLYHILFKFFSRFKYFFLCLLWNTNYFLFPYFFKIFSHVLILLNYLFVFIKILEWLNKLSSTVIYWLWKILMIIFLEKIVECNTFTHLISL